MPEEVGREDPRWEDDEHREGDSMSHRKGDAHNMQRGARGKDLTGELHAKQRNSGTLAPKLYQMGIVIHFPKEFS